MKTMKVLFMVLLALATTACSKGDDEEATPKQKTIDPALLGVWLNKEATSVEDFTEAASFKTNGDVLLYYQNGWFLGTYNVLEYEENHFILDVHSVKMNHFTDFDHFDAVSDGTFKSSWVVIYKITGNKLYLERGGRSMNLVKYE